MMPWFVWKDKNSLSDFGLWISKLPKRVRAEERHEEIEIPGRAGSLLMLEGDDVYSSYTVELVIVTRTDTNVDPAVEWLRGSGELVLCTDTDKAYQARIVGEVAFERISNTLQQATVPFLMQPFRKSRYIDKDRFSLTSSSAIFINPGDVVSKPVISITGNGNNTITIGGNSMQFSSLSGTVVVDCDAQIITKNGAIWTQSVTGDFLTIPVGEFTISQTGSMTINVDPNWRWL